MEESGKEDRDNNTSTELNTFPIPFPLGEDKESISIYTYTSIQLSKEQIINQAFKLHSQGNISEAKKHYQYFINQGFNDPIIFCCF